MNRVHAALMIVVCFPAKQLTGQVTLLTAREAKELVELTPEVAASRARGECPMLSVFGPPADIGFFSIEARGACWHSGDASSLLINNYVVNRKTGTVALDASHSVISTPEMRQRAKAMLILAKGRVLSIAESRCIAIEAGKAALVRGRGRGKRAIPEPNLPSAITCGRVSRPSLIRETAASWSGHTTSAAKQARRGTSRPGKRLCPLV